jgi:hypothetical protein
MPGHLCCVWNWSVPRWVFGLRTRGSARSCCPAVDIYIGAWEPVTRYRASLGWALSTFTSVRGMRLGVFRSSVIVKYQPMTIAKLTAFVAAETEFDVRWRLVVELLKEYHREPAGERQRLLADAPRPTGGERWDVLFAGLAEHLAMRDGGDAPSRSAPRGLRRSWFPFDAPGVRAQALVHAPAALRRRGVFVADYEIEAA